MATLVREEKYVKSDLNNNNNKFWYARVYDDGTFVTQWGRVGDAGQSKTFNCGSVAEAERMADAKIKEKTRDGRNGEIAYRKIETVGNGTPTASASIKTVANSNLHQIAKNQIKTNNPLVDDLVKYLTKVNAHQITSASAGKITYSDTTGLFSTPLGIITQSNIDQANDILLTIGDLVAARKYDGKKIVDLTNDYLMLVPQDFGRHRLDVREFWADTSKLQYQKQILDGLQTSYASAIKSPASNTNGAVDTPEERVFDLQLDLIDNKVLIKNISNQFETSKKGIHASSNYKVKTVYGVKIGSERERFEQHGRSIGNVQRLYHGSSATNLLSIMKQGLIVPPKSSPHVCGRMWGDGLYFANSSSKSLNYSIGYWGGKTADRVFMFMADVAVGNHYTPAGTHDGPFPRKGYDSIWAKAGKSGVINDEIIVYSTKQCSLTYLLELTQ